MMPIMNNEQLIYFEALAAHRKHLSNVLDGLALRFVKTSVVEKYSDQGAFHL